jgi:hypothetical protein
MATKDRRTSYSIDPNLERGPFEAIVRNVLDPKYSGTLQVELLRTLESGDLHVTGQLVKAQYLHPFYGATSPLGISKNDSAQHSQQSYGMWFVPPDIGNRVMVIFVEGNINRAYWIGCVQQASVNFALPDHTVSTENTDTDDPALLGKKLPVGEHNKAKASQYNDGSLSKPLDIKKPINYLVKAMLENQGLIEDETRGITTSSARREVPTAVFGISTPGPLDKEFVQNAEGNLQYARLGGTNLIMDDGDDKFVRKTKASQGPYQYVNAETLDPDVYVSEEKQSNIPHNELFRIRTRTGHQILLHNSEDLIYIANANGTAWIEMTANGKIDFFAQDSVSIHSQTDFNFKADRDVNVEAGRSINLKARSSITEESLGSHTVTVGTNQTITVANLQTVSVATTNHYATGNINQDTGGVINLNNGFAVETPPTPLSTHENPGESYGNIMKRVPQHEPWSHHENYDPQAVSTAKTDRTTIEQVSVKEPNNIPDTFKNART